jgi:SAM-dependent methyltransferase
MFEVLVVESKREHFVEQQHLERLRKAEIDMVRRWFKPGLRVLEIGGGNGFQANILASWSCEVTSIDLPRSPAHERSYYAVQEYDGRKIPYADQSFDIVFSSNVLEHIEHLSSMLQEISRVLKSDGLMIHILPSSSWRFWTCLSHYLNVVRVGLAKLVPAYGRTPSLQQERSRAGRSRVHLIKRALFDGPHGAYPSAFYELYAFSRSRWLRVFCESGFEVVGCQRNDLFYTGYVILPSLSLASRRIMSRFLGPAAHIYVMCKG